MFSVFRVALVGVRWGNQFDMGGDSVECVFTGGCGRSAKVIADLGTDVLSAVFGLWVELLHDLKALVMYVIRAEKAGAAAVTAALVLKKVEAYPASALLFVPC